MRTAERLLKTGYETLLTGAVWFALMLWTGWTPTWPAMVVLLGLAAVAFVAAAVCGGVADARQVENK